LAVDAGKTPGGSPDGIATFDPSFAGFENFTEMTAEDIHHEAVLDPNLAAINKVLRERFARDPQYRKEMRAKLQFVQAQRRAEPEETSVWIGAWRMLLASTPTIRKEGRREVRRLFGERDGVIAQIADPEDSPKKKKVEIEDEESYDAPSEFGAADEY
jgi:DNA-binding transcriptional regulator PaaX